MILCTSKFTTGLKAANSESAFTTTLTTLFFCLPLDFVEIALVVVLSSVQKIKQILMEVVIIIPTFGRVDSVVNFAGFQSFQDWIIILTINNNSNKTSNNNNDEDAMNY